MPDTQDTQTLRLIDALYEAAVRPERWPGFLELLGRTLRANGTAFVHQDLETRDDAVLAMVGLTSTQMKQYEEHYAATNPYISAMHGFHVGSVIANERVCRQEVLERTECFQDFFKPLGLVHVLGAIIARDGAAVTNLSVQRDKRAGPFTDAECLLVEGLVPHMQRVVQIHRRLSGAERTGPLSEAADRLPIGLILTNSRGAVLFMNRAARLMLDSRDGLSLSRSRLCASCASESVALERLICAASARASKVDLDPGGSLSVSRPSMERPYLVVVAPIHGSREAWLATGQPSAAVFVSDPSQRVEPPELWLRRAYGLTRAEAHLAALLTAGASLEEATATLGVRRETARTHLKRVLQKTDTRRQSELIGTILRAVAGLPVSGTGGKLSEASRR